MDVNTKRGGKLQYSGKQKKTWKQRLWDYVVLTFAAVMYAGAIGLFLDPNLLAPGGVTGISIILNRLTGLETGTWILIINIPILLLGAWKFGLRFILSTIYCIGITSFCTNLFSTYGALTADYFLAALIGGALMAVAMGTILKRGATTGGMDIIIKVLKLKLPHLKTGFLFLLTDAVVVAASATIFQNVDRALYAGLVVFIAAFVLDMVLYGHDGAKLIYIISDHSESITKRILEELGIGVTHVQGMGAYSGREKNVIMCAIKKPLAHRAEEIVKQEDPQAFMIVTSAMEIYGEGYKSYFSEKI